MGGKKYLFLFSYSVFAEQSQKCCRGDRVKISNMRTLVNITCTAIRVCVITKRVDIARRHQSSYGVAWLNLTAPIDFWRNSTQFFGVKVHALPVPPTRCSCLPWIYITAL